MVMGEAKHGQKPNKRNILFSYKLNNASSRKKGVIIGIY